MSFRLKEAKLILKLAFSDVLPYVRNEGFRTPAKAGTSPRLRYERFKAKQAHRYRPPQFMTIYTYKKILPLF